MQIGLRTKNYKLKANKGYVTLVSILVIGAVGLAVVTSLVLLGVGSSRSSFSLEQGSQAKALANACAEEALQQIWNDDAFVGTGNLTLGQGNCSFAVSSVILPKTIVATGMIGTTARKISITIDALRPYLHIVSWQEIAN